MNGNILFTKQISWGKIRINKWVNKYIINFWRFKLSSNHWFTHVHVSSTSYCLLTKDKNFKVLFSHRFFIILYMYVVIRSLHSILLGQLQLHSIVFCVRIHVLLSNFDSLSLSCIRREENDHQENTKRRSGSSNWK